jgi:hypothetical protein
MRSKTLNICTASLILGIFFLSTSSCQKDDQQFLFEVSHSFTINVPSGQNPFESLVFPFESIQSLIVEELTNRGMTIADVNNIQTSRARLDLNTFEGDLSVFHTIVCNIYLGPDPKDNPYEAGYTIEIRDRFTDRLDIVPSLTNLRDALTKDRFNMELVLSSRRILAVPFQATFSISFGVID